MKNFLIFALVLGLGIVVGKAGVYLYDRFLDPPPQAVVEGDFTEYASDRPVLFMTSTCPFCKQAVSYLDSKKIDYDKKVIDQSAEAKAEYGLLKQNAVPLLVTKSVMIAGYRPAEYDRFLDKGK